ncbi:MAG: DUF5710 domain-containing protein [Succinivibrionaceae bacterium]
MTINENDKVSEYVPHNQIEQDMCDFANLEIPFSDDYVQLCTTSEMENSQIELMDYEQVVPQTGVNPTQYPQSTQRNYNNNGNSNKYGNSNYNNGPKTYLNVSYAEKDEAKSLGAKWDAEARKWYVPFGVDVNLFKKWLIKN